VKNPSGIYVENDKHFEQLFQQLYDRFYVLGGGTRRKVND